MTKTLLGAAAALALLAGGPAFAQQGGSTTAPTTTAPATAAPSVTIVEIDPILMERRIDELEEMDVYSADGEEIGDVEEIVRRDGMLYAVIEAGGFLGLGETELAIPLNHFRFQNERLTLPMTAAEFEAFEEYAEGDYEQIHDGFVRDHRVR